MSDGFSEAEREAMRQRAEELRAERGGKKKADYLAALLETIDQMPLADKAIAVAVHQIVNEVAPHLTPRTWYGMPAYELDGAVLMFVQHASKFDVRYTTLGFNDNAALDEGVMWPTSFAITEINDEVRNRIKTLLVQALG